MHFLIMPSSFVRIKSLYTSCISSPFCEFWSFLAKMWLSAQIWLKSWMRSFKTLGSKWYYWMISMEVVRKALLSRSCILLRLREAMLWTPIIQCIIAYPTELFICSSSSSSNWIWDWAFKMSSSMSNTPNSPMTRLKFREHMAMLDKVLTA